MKEKLRVNHVNGTLKIERNIASPAIIPVKYQIYYCRAFPDAESYLDIRKRLELFMKEVLNSKYDRIIIVSHGIALHLFYGMWVGMDLSELKKYGFWAMAAGV
jgi:broad specificity phosphatase PhoE